MRSGERSLVVYMFTCCLYVHVCMCIYINMLIHIINQHEREIVQVCFITITGGLPLVEESSLTFAKRSSNSAVSSSTLGAVMPP